MAKPIEEFAATLKERLMQVDESENEK